MELIEIIKNDIDSFFTHHHELMFNERDFQMHLATWLKESANGYDDVDVEYYIPYKILDNYIWKSELRLDIVVKKNDEYIPIELKYKTKSVSKKLLRFDEEIKDSEGNDSFQVMKNQGAQDIGRYDFWKDVRRLELVCRHFRQTKGGLAVFLTNDDAYLKELGNSNNNCMFSMNEGCHAPQKSWLNPDSATARTRPPFTLEKEYKIQWQPTCADYIKFNYCIITV